MTEPNRLSLPGESAARGRVEEVFAAVDRLAARDLANVVVATVDPSDRNRRLESLESLAAARGRADLLADALQAVRRHLDTLVSEAQLVVMYGHGASVPARVEDQVRTYQAIEDAVAVAVMEDALDVDDARVLSSRGRSLLGLPPIGEDRAGGGEPPRRPTWEPSAAEWVDAAGSSGIDRDAPMPGQRGFRWFLFGAIALIGIPAAIGGGVASGQVLLGVLFALAIGALCWTFATYRPAR